jgi:hypothetical protein
VEHLINQALGTDIFHIHLERGVSQKGDVYLSALLGMEAPLNAIINKSHQASCDNDAANEFSWMMTR